MFHITEKTIDAQGLSSELIAVQAGALVCFEGRVRDHNDGKKVCGLEYEVYHELATKEGLAILAEAKERFAILEARAVHREGKLGLGDIAVWIGVLSAHRDAAFRAARYIIDTIKTRLPIWKKESYTDGPSEWIACTHSEVHCSKDDYYRQQIGAVGRDGQERLRTSRVLVVGLGGLGCPVTLSLAGAGVGTLTLCDGDRLELSNLHRQSLYSIHDVGMRKADLAKERIQALNPFTKVHALAERLDGKNVSDLVRDHDIVIDCTDNFATKFLLHDTCFQQKRPLVQASLYAGDGVLQSFQDFEQGCMRCLWSEVPDASCAQACTDAGVLGAQTSLLGSMQAMQALQILLGRKVPNDVWYVNLDDFSSVRVPRQKNSDCPTCSGREIALATAEASTTRFLDVRQNASVADLRTTLIKDEKTILICQKGIRSKRLVEDLRKEGFERVYSLQGGLDGLSLD